MAIILRLGQLRNQHIKKQCASAVGHGCHGQCPSHGKDPYGSMTRGLAGTMKVAPHVGTRCSRTLTGAEHEAGFGMDVSDRMRLIQ